MARSKSDTALPDGAHTDFRGGMTYGDYLQLETLLGAQKPLSGCHDETLFIIVHQATELWMRLVIHEMRATLACIRRDDLAPAFKMLARISRIQSQLIQSWDVLSTMTPADYMAFRDSLGLASGFQSHQFRAIEFMMGNKNRAMLAPYRDRPATRAALEEVLNAPGLYDEVLRLLDRRGFPIAAGRLERDWAEPYQPDETVRAAWLAIYRDTALHWDLYELAEELVDLEDWFRQWRFRHLTTVERIIGMKRGTGGTAGVSYLAKALDMRYFPELWDIRTAI